MNASIPVNTIIPSQFLQGLDSLPKHDGTVMMAEIEREAHAQFRDAVESIKVIMRSYVCVVATSFGKDSTVVMLAAIQAIRELLADGEVPADTPLVMTNIDTGVENHLVQMLSLYEQERLKAFCRREGINLDLRVGTPPLAKMWAALFLSGLKIISTARLNNDCSEIMKVDNAANIERSVSRDYGNRVVTLLGSRTDESTRRAASLKKRGQDTLTADELVERDQSGDRVFAPIVNMTDEHVWTLLRRAGTHPLTESYANLPTIPSYAKNHRLLHIIYSDSKDGTCPTSAKRIAGDKQKAGGCGGSARTGCYLCAKSVLDKSGEAQARQKRHKVISGNIIKVRNYIMYVAQNLEHRTWHSRAMDELTGAIALQPNVLNAETIDKIMWLLSQATHEDRERAERFRDLVAQGREMDDAGYADIINDTMMSDEDRDEFASVYKKYAQRQLIKPMSAKLALYLSMIHSRDGVKLPPFRAIHVWNATCEGERIPYPDVDPTKAVISDIPDPVMVIPSMSIQHLGPIPGADTLAPETSEECDFQPVPYSAKMPVRDAKFYLSPKELAKLSGKNGSEEVDVGYLSAATVSQKIRMNPRNLERKREFSKRAIKKASRKGGVRRILERGRTSVNSHSFSHRSETPGFEKKILTPVNIYCMTSRKQHWMMDYFESPDIGGYELDECQVAQWLDIEGAERALKEHDEFLESRARHGESIYHWGGLGPFNTMMRYSLFNLTRTGKREAARIVRRTGYFNAIGVLGLNDAQLRKLALSANGAAPGEIKNYRPSIKVKAEFNIDAIYPMAMYRNHKAQELLSLRKERNARRRELKLQYRAFWQDPVEGLCQQLTNMWASWEEVYTHNVEDFLLADALKHELRGFDGIHIPRQWSLTNGFIRHFEAFYSDLEVMYSLLDKPAVDILKGSPLKRRAVLDHARELLSQMNEVKVNMANQVLQNVNTKGGRRTLYFWLEHQHDAVQEVAKAALNERLTEWEGVEKRCDNTLFQQAFSISDVSVEQGGMQW